jgi:hypothetical protein
VIRIYETVTIDDITATAITDTIQQGCEPCVFWKISCRGLAYCTSTARSESGRKTGPEGVIFVPPDKALLARLRGYYDPT